MERLAIKRGWFYKTTKEPLIEEAARTIIRDYHKAKIPFTCPQRNSPARSSTGGWRELVMTRAGSEVTPAPMKSLWDYPLRHSLTPPYASPVHSDGCHEG